VDGPPYFSDSGEIPLLYDKLNVLVHMGFHMDCRLGTPNSGWLVRTSEGRDSEEEGFAGESRGLGGIWWLLFNNEGN